MSNMEHWKCTIADRNTMAHGLRNLPYCDNKHTFIGLTADCRTNPTQRGKNCDLFPIGKVL